MRTHADKTQDNKGQSVAKEVAQKQSSNESTIQFVDNRLEAIQMRKLQEMADNSQQVNQANPLQTMANNYAAKQLPQIQNKGNNTGLPDNLKSGMENLSGYSLDDVKVPYNSAKPAQIQALAYAQGSDIHLGLGQERHLPHELGHVVQQAQGRIKPPTNVNGKSVNDDASLENEATAMSDRVLQMAGDSFSDIVQRRAFSVAEPFVSQFWEEQDSDGFQPMGGDFDGVSFRTMSAQVYDDWKDTIQAKRIHGIASHNGVVVVTQFSRNSDVVQQAGFLENAKGYLVGAEGVLAIAAGIALCAATGGAGVIPGILAIVTGVIKIARGFLMVKWGSEASSKQKKVIDAMRILEAFVAIGAAAATGNIGVWIFGVAKAIRSLLTAITDQMGDGNPQLKLWLQRISAACHFVESFAVAGVGAGALAGDSIVTGLAGVGTGFSKLTRAGDQATAVAPSAETRWQ